MFTEVSAEGFEINLVKTMLDLLIWKRNISFITNSSVWHVWLASKKCGIYIFRAVMDVLMLFNNWRLLCKQQVSRMNGWKWPENLLWNIVPDCPTIKCRLTTCSHTALVWYLTPWRRIVVLNRGYYAALQRYKISLCSLMKYFSTQEENIHISEWPLNFLFIT